MISELPESWVNLAWLAMASHANFIIVQYMGLPSGNPT